MKMEYKLEEVLSHINMDYVLKGKGNDVLITHAASVLACNAYSLTWVSPTHPLQSSFVVQTRSRLIVCSDTLELTESMLTDKYFIVVQNPKLVFSNLLNSLFVEEKHWGIHSSAIVHPEAQLTEPIYIGPNCYVGKCTLHKYVRLEGNNFIYDNTTIHENTTIQAGTVIGADGFGYSKNENNEFAKFPHIGGVIIEGNVDIGSNTCIDRGTLGNTIIKKGAKIDNLVHIAHNVTIGENTVVIALAMIGGSTSIESNVWVAPSSAVRDGVVIAEGATVGMGAIITKSIPKDEIWFGNPGKKKQ
jgi:UDP-3-O-[3-hydroxymyristoyl] glucosamine N-acyltransferase